MHNSDYTCSYNGISYMNDLDLWPWHTLLCS